LLDLREPDVAQRRQLWEANQGRLDPQRLVFIDETWAKTNTTPLRGWAPRGRKLVARVSQGRRKTSTFLAALRCDRIHPPCVIDGPMNGERFRAYVEQLLAGELPTRSGSRSARSSAPSRHKNAPTISEAQATLQVRWIAL